MCQRFICKDAGPAGHAPSSAVCTGGGNHRPPHAEVAFVHPTPEMLSEQPLFLPLLYRHTYIRACICIISILESKNRVQTFQTPREHVFTDFSTKIIIYLYRAQINLIGVGFRANTELYLGVELRAGGLGRAPASLLCGRAVQGPPSGIFSVIPFCTHLLLLSSLFCGL